MQTKFFWMIEQSDTLYMWTVIWQQLNKICLFDRCSCLELNVLLVQLKWATNVSFYLLGIHYRLFYLKGHGLITVVIQYIVSVVYLVSYFCVWMPEQPPTVTGRKQQVHLQSSTAPIYSLHCMHAYFCML